jgi:hypothetical protein
MLGGQHEAHSLSCFTVHCFAAACCISCQVENDVCSAMNLSQSASGIALKSSGESILNGLALNISSKFENELQAETNSGGINSVSATVCSPLISCARGTAHSEMLEGHDLTTNGEPSE